MLMCALKDVMPAIAPMLILTSPTPDVEVQRLPLNSVHKTLPDLIQVRIAAFPSVEDSSLLLEIPYCSKYALLWRLIQLRVLARNATSSLQVDQGRKFAKKFYSPASEHSKLAAASV